MQPTMYGMQSKPGIGYTSGSGAGSGFLAQTRGYAKQNRFSLQNKGGYYEYDNFPSENQDSPTYSNNQQGRFSDYSDYGSYDDGYGGYGVDKTGKSAGYGYGAQSYGSYASGYGKQCPGISIALLLISLLGVALMGWILYSKIVAAGRRKRDVAEMADLWWFVDNFVPILINGLDEFEEKLEKVADGRGDSDWISQLYSKFSPTVSYGSHGGDLAVKDWGGLEPPILDTTWGLGRVGTINTQANVTVGEAHGLHIISSEDTETEAADAEVSCRVTTWQCVAKAIEGSLHYLDNPDGLTGLVQKTLFKMAFHGGSGNVWSGLMQILEIRQVRHCLTAHDECVTYQVISREDTDYQDYPWAKAEGSKLNKNS